MPLIVLFIESAILSLLSKIFQLAGALACLKLAFSEDSISPSVDLSCSNASAIALNAYIFPICVSTRTVSI